AVLVIVVLREGRGDVGGGIAGLQLFDPGVHRVIDFAIQVDFLLGHLARDFEATNEVDEVARRTDGIDVDDYQVALANQLIGGPAPVRAGVAAGSYDDVVDNL